MDCEYEDSRLEPRLVPLVPQCDQQVAWEHPGDASTRLQATTAHMLFSHEERAACLTANPAMGRPRSDKLQRSAFFDDLDVATAAKWGGMSKAQRQKYGDMAAAYAFTPPNLNKGDANSVKACVNKLLKSLEAGAKTAAKSEVIEIKRLIAALVKTVISRETNPNLNY